MLAPLCLRQSTTSPLSVSPVANPVGIGRRYGAWECRFRVVCGQISQTLFRVKEKCEVEKREDWISSLPDAVLVWIYRSGPA
jgi:hypothetical protein